MISRPYASQLLLAARQELLDVVLPAVSTDRARVSIEMIENLLRSCAARCDHEIAWMREETTAIVALGERLVATGADPDGTIAAALDAVRASDQDSDHLADVQQRYDRAGEVLSCCLERAVALGGDVLADARGVLRQRQEREMEILGEFGFVGRG